MLNRTIRRCLTDRSTGVIEAVLRDEVGLHLRRNVGDVEWAQALRELKEAGEIEFGEDRDLKDRTVKLKKGGKR